MALPVERASAFNEAWESLRLLFARFPLSEPDTIIICSFVPRCGAAFSSGVGLAPLTVLSFLVPSHLCEAKERGFTVRREFGRWGYDDSRPGPPGVGKSSGVIVNARPRELGKTRSEQLKSAPARRYASAIIRLGSPSGAFVLCRAERHTRRDGWAKQRSSF